MARRERVKISLFEPAVISGGGVLPAASTSLDAKLSTFRGVGDGGGGSNGGKDRRRSTALGVKASVVNTKDATPGTRKRGASVNGSRAVATEKVPSRSPSQCRPKKVTTTAHGSAKAHHHRRSPSLHIDDAAECSASSAPAPRTLRQSASFPGGIASAPRPGARDAQASLAPRARAGKSVRHRSSISRRVEEDDATLCEDHNVQVVIRARPVNGAEIALQGKFARCVRQENARTLSWLGKPEARFTFDHVAGEFVTQGELFQVAGVPMVDNCMAGYNSCMFAYGQTGSGKTHTMLGDIEDSENRGMAPRVFEYLFAMIRKEEEAQKHGKLKYTCRCSFLEIYNEQISDLLEPSSASLQMREDVKKGVFVEGLREVEVQNVDDVLHLLLLGAANRKVAATNVNRESSRSHSVFTCAIESQWECDSMINFRFGRLNLVDLAGSERQKDTGGDGERLREAASINKSLSTLGNVIMVLVDFANGKQRHVPYRDSKLTFLLQDSLGGNSKTTIIANISPSSCASSETLSTLKFAQRAKFIQNNAVINEKLASGDVKGMREKIEQLKDELARIRRRQSVSKTSSGRLSVKKDASVSTEEFTGESAEDGLDSLSLSRAKGSFLHVGIQAVPSPTVLNHKMKAMEALLVGVLRREKPQIESKTSAAELEHLALLVKQREDETYLHKSTLVPQESREQEIRSETCDAEERLSVALELESQQCNNHCHTRLDVENTHLQERLPRCQTYDAFDERKTMMVQDISNLRKKLLDMLDRNISMDAAAARPQHEALVAELAAERQTAEHLRNEVESHQRGLLDCQMKLRNSLESKERISSELDALRVELQSSQEECRKYKQDLATLQLTKTLEVNCLQPQHQNVVLEFKTLLQKSEEKVKQEAIWRNQIELQLHQALQESSNLQTELQWAKDSLEGSEAAVEAFQRSEPVLEIGDPDTSYVGFMVEQLQAKIIQLHAMLEDERRHGRELEDQIKAKYGISQGFAYTLPNDCGWSTENPGHVKIKHQEAVLQLQMELASLEGCAPDAMKCYKWEEDPAATYVEALNGALTEAKVPNDHLQQQLEDLTQSNLSAEKALNVVDSLPDRRKGNEDDLKPGTQEGGGFFSKLQQEWEGAALRMFDHLSLLAAGYESEQDVVKDNTTTLSLKERLLQAQMLAASADRKLQDVSDLMLKSMASWADTCNIMDAVLQPYQSLRATKSNLEACYANLREVGQKSAVASTLMWWMSETSTFRMSEAPRDRLTWDGKKRQLEAEKEVLEMQVQSDIGLLENILLELTSTEARVHEVADKIQGESEKSKKQVTAIAREQALVAAVAEAEQRCIGTEAARLKLEEELGKHLAATRELQHQIKMKEEEIVKLKEQAAAGQANYKLLEESNLQVTYRDSEERSVEKIHIITNLETEADSTALKSTIANLQRELQETSQERSEEVSALVSQLHVSDRHIFKLECQSVELRNAMQRQAVAIGALHQTPESLQEAEKAELTAYRKKAEKYQAKSRKLESQVETLQQELNERMQPLQEEIVLIYEELHASRTAADIAAQQTKQLRTLMDNLERSRDQLQEEVKRKQCAIEAVEEHLLKSEQSKLQCQEKLHLYEQKTEVNKTRAQEKQVEVEILRKSVEELENTVYALESQVGLLKREGERQCLVRQDMERELQGLKQQNVNALSQRKNAKGDEGRREFINTERKLKEREAEIQLLRKKLEKYQIGSEGKNSLPQPKDIQKKPKGSIESAFRWLKMNHQVHSELHEEKKVYERRIQDMEDALRNRQNEITALKEKLADAERVTHAVLRVLKVDMTNVATLVEKQQVEADGHVKGNNRTQFQKDDEVERMLTQLNNFMDERKSWVAVISRKQAELAATHVALGKLQEREMALVAENKKFKIENRMQVKKMGQLEQDIKALSGQQTKHHVKIKATGMLDCNNNNNNDTGSPSVTLEALEQMKAPLESTQLEHKDFKLKKKIELDKRQRLSEMTSTHSPIRGIDSQSVKPR